MVKIEHSNVTVSYYNSQQIAEDWKPILKCDLSMLLKTNSVGKKS